MTAVAVTPLSVEQKWYDHDFHLYGRQSLLASFGNASTTMQEEDLLAKVAENFRFNPHQHPGLFQYPIEVKSGTDADIEIDFSGGQNTEGILVKYPRKELMAVLERIVARYKATGRKSVIVVFMLNRLARNGDFLLFLNQAVRQTDRNVLIWSTKEGWVDPSTKEGQLMLNVHCGLSGGGESDTKSFFSKNAHRLVAESQPTRSMGERIVGYRVEKRQSGRGKEESHHVRDESQAAVVRRAFDLFIEGDRPPAIARKLNADGYRHPHTGQPFGQHVIKLMLRDSIYVGRRVRLKRRTRSVGSKKQVNRPASEWVASPYDESLVIISDEVFERAQVIIQERATRGFGRRASGGRPAQYINYFTRGGLLRCAGCGSALTQIGSGKAARYMCRARAERLGQPHCQSHVAHEVDAALDDMLVVAFSQFSEHVELLRKELSEQTSQVRRAEIEASLRQKQGMLSRAEEELFNDIYEAAAKDRLRARYNQINEEVASLQRALDAFGETEDIKRKKALVVRAELLAGYEKLTPEERRGVMTQYIERVWIWPDHTIFIERRGRPLDLSQSPIYLEDGHEVLYAKDWPLLDLDRMKAELRRMREAGLLEPALWHPLVTHNVSSRAMRYNFDRLSPHALTRIYFAALDTAVDPERLHAALWAKVDETMRAEGLSVLAAGRKLGIEMRVKNLQNKVYRTRLALVEVAELLGVNWREFRPPMENYYRPDYLEEMVKAFNQNDGNVGEDSSTSETECKSWPERGSVDVVVVTPVWSYEEFRGMVLQSA